MSDDNKKLNSRKYSVVIISMIMIGILAILIGVLAFVGSNFEIEMPLLQLGIAITILSGVPAAYLGVNVMQKRIESGGGQ